MKIINIVLEFFRVLIILLDIDWLKYVKTFCNSE